MVGLVARRPELRGGFDPPASRLDLSLVRAVVHCAMYLVQLCGLIVVAIEGSGLKLGTFDQVAYAQQADGEVLIGGVESHGMNPLVDLFSIKEIEAKNQACGFS